jgi:hypothetical protein
MYWLRHPVYARAFPAPRSSVFPALIAKLKELHFEIEKASEEKGVIVVRCLTVPLGIILWRCWSDKLVFELSGIGQNKTQLDVYAIPNLFKTRLDPGETAVDAGKLLSQLAL